MSKALEAIEVQPDLFGTFTVIISYRRWPGPVQSVVCHNVEEEHLEEAIEVLLEQRLYSDRGAEEQ